MQPRESIPNVGRRAQGRKALFMLKGRGVSGASSSPVDPEDAAQRAHQQLTQGSLTMGSEAGNGELTEPPVSYDESILSQPSHPYNRIIQKILLRHRAAQRKEVQEHTGSRLPLRTDRQHGQGTSTSSAPPHVTRHIHLPASHLCLSKPRVSRADPENDDHTSNRKLEEAENDSGLQWSDILTADHCVTNDRLDLQCCDESTDGTPVSSARTSSRTIISDRSQAGSDLLGEDSLDTARSEPLGVSSLPRLARKRDLNPLDDVLDYFWVYQGMSRQLLHLHLPHDLWGRRKWLKKKPTKLPPLYISSGQKSEATSLDSTRPPRLSSEDLDILGVTPQEKNTARQRCDPKSQQSTIPSVSRPEDQASEVRGPSDDLVDNAHGRVDDNTNTCQFRSPDAVGERRRTRKVPLVVRMPVLTQESTNSDLLENE